MITHKEKLGTKLKLVPISCNPIKISCLIHVYQLTKDLRVPATKAGKGDLADSGQPVVEGLPLAVTDGVRGCARRNITVRQETVKGVEGVADGVQSLLLIVAQLLKVVNLEERLDANEGGADFGLEDFAAVLFTVLGEVEEDWRGRDVLRNRAGSDALVEGRTFDAIR